MHSWLLHTAKWLIFSRWEKSILCLVKIGFSSSSLTFTKPGEQRSHSVRQCHLTFLGIFKHGLYRMQLTIWMSVCLYYELQKTETDEPEWVIPMLAAARRLRCCADCLVFCESSYSSSIEAMVQLWSFITKPLREMAWKQESGHQHEKPRMSWQDYRPLADPWMDRLELFLLCFNNQYTVIERTHVGCSTKLWSLNTFVQIET